MTITRTDIHNITINACGQDFDADTLNAITDAVLNAAPLATWRLNGLDYVSDDLDTAEFWAIVERTAEARR